MKLYLSSIRIPSPDSLAKLLGKPLNSVSVALIPNAKDYYSERARNYLVNDLISYMKQLSLSVNIVDLRDYSDSELLKQKLANYDLLWVMGGNTFVLRYEMKRSGFEDIIQQLLDKGIVYGGDSAGALAAGLSIAGVELADEPQFAEEIIEDGLSLVPFFILPHIDNHEFTAIVPIFENLHQNSDNIIRLKDSQAVIFDSESHRIVNAEE